MAINLINVGTANQGDGDPLRDAFVKANDMFTELYSDDAGDVDSVNGQTGVVVLDSDDVSEGATNLYNQTHTGEVTGATSLTIANDVISYAKMADEFTTSAVISASDVDFSSAQVFTKTLTGTTALTYSSASIGMVKDLVINADGNSFTLPAGTKIIAGTATTGINFIQVVVTASGEYWTSISQQQ